MRRVFNIAVVLSLVLCGISLVLLVLSTFFPLPASTRQGIDADSAIPVGGGFHFAVSEGCLWFFNGEFPYEGSILGLHDDRGLVTGPGTWRVDWDWSYDSFGFMQETLLGESDEFVVNKRYGDLPGLYYRRFKWWNIDGAWRTLIVSLLYPVGVFSILPSWLIIRKVRAARFQEAAKPLADSGVH